MGRVLSILTIRIYIWYNFNDRMCVASVSLQLFRSSIFVSCWKRETDTFFSHHVYGSKFSVSVMHYVKSLLRSWSCDYWGKYFRSTSSVISVTMVLGLIWSTVQECGTSRAKTASSELGYRRFSSWNMRLDVNFKQKPFFIASWCGKSLHWVFCPPVLYAADKARFLLKG